MSAPPMRPAVEAILQTADASSEPLEIQPLAGDASTRLFYRCKRPDGSTMIVMDYGAPFEGENDDILLQRIFVAAQLPCAEILAIHPCPGFLVWSDLGTQMLEQSLIGATDVTPPESWLAAIRLAAEIADRGSPVLANSSRRDGPTLDAERFRFEMDFFVTHFMESYLQSGPPPSALKGALHRLAEEAAQTPRAVFCHRDFHSRNIVLSEQGRLALVDLQDARWGPDSYDLASWLYDAYIQRPDPWVEIGIRTYLSALDHPPDPHAFEQRLIRVSSQRMLKALGSFGYLASKRKKQHYLEGVPRTVSRLRSLLPEFDCGAEILSLLEPLLP
jgi:aminoglycoside/choline kinase family phosphotransferase